MIVIDYNGLPVINWCTEGFIQYDATNIIRSKFSKNMWSPNKMNWILISPNSRFWAENNGIPSIVEK